MNNLELKFKCMLCGREFTKSVEKKNCLVMSDGYVHIKETCPACGTCEEFLGAPEQFVKLLEG